MFKFDNEACDFIFAESSVDCERVASVVKVIASSPIIRDLDYMPDVADFLYDLGRNKERVETVFLVSRPHHSENNFFILVVSMQKTLSLLIEHMQTYHNLGYACSVSDCFVVC